VRLELERAEVASRVWDLSLGGALRGATCLYRERDFSDENTRFRKLDIGLLAPDADGGGGALLLLLLVEILLVGLMAVGELGLSN